MSDSPFTFLHRRNARLFRFLDRCHNVAGIIHRLIIHFDHFANQKGLEADKMLFEMMASPDGRHVHIRIK